jgi:hypothetical protein
MATMVANSCAAASSAIGIVIGSPSPHERRPVGGDPETAVPAAITQVDARAERKFTAEQNSGVPITRRDGLC